MEVIISQTAYCKLFSHLAKYPHLSCNGLLLTKKQQQQSNNKLEYVECIPLFHSSLSLAPSLEIALFQVDSYCQANDLEISGYYQANENTQDNKYLYFCRFNFISSLLNYFIMFKQKIQPDHVQNS